MYKSEELQFIDQTPRMGSFEEAVSASTSSANGAGSETATARPNLQLLSVTPGMCIPNRRKSRPLRHSAAITPRGASSFGNRASLPGAGAGAAYSFSNSGHSSMSSMIGGEQDSTYAAACAENVEENNVMELRERDLPADADSSASVRKNTKNAMLHAAMAMGNSDEHEAYCLQLDIDVPHRSASACIQPLQNQNQNQNQNSNRSRRSASVRSTSAQSGELALISKGTQTEPQPNNAHVANAALHSFRTSGSQQSASASASASATRYNAHVVADIGTEVLRQTGAYPGFKQLQKVFSHSQSNSNLNQNAAGELGANLDDALSVRAVAAAAASISRHASRTSVAVFERFEREDLVAKSLLANDCTVGPVVPVTPPAIMLDQSDNNSTKVQLKRARARASCNHSQPEIGYRLGRRKKLYETRRRIADYTLLCAIFGIITAVIEMEATLATANIYRKNDLVSLIVKSVITVSTVILLTLEITYHVVEIRLFCIDNCIEDWRVAIDCKRAMLTSCKLLICSIHPFPGAPTFEWAMVDLRGFSLNPEVSLDVVLTLPMFLRLYLIFRVMLLHSKLFTDASSRSIGAMNRIKFNIRFVLKTLMTLCPGTVLLVLILSLLIVASWSIRVCEGQHKAMFLNMLNSLWFISITFMSIGYGDIVPESVCGRLIAVFTGMMGSGCMALVVAVVARKLELTRAEKHVHNFMMDNQLTKSLRSSAANVLRETWLIYKYTKLSKRINPYKVRYHQRKFFDAIQALRKVKLDQRKLADHNARLVDLPKLHHQLHDSIMESHSGQEQLKEQVQRMAERMQVLESIISSMPQAVASQIVTVIGDQLKNVGLQIQDKNIQQHQVNADDSTKPILWCEPLSGTNGGDYAVEQHGTESRTSHNLINSCSADSAARPPLSDQAKAVKIASLDGAERQMSRQTSSASQPARRMLKLAEMPETFKSHSAV